jgi:chemotaxis signal transduction protein
MMNSRYILFEWMRDYYAVPIGDVIEILEIKDMIKTNNRQINVSSWNGRTVPVLDPIAMISYDPMTPSVKTKVLLVEKRQMKYGILVENIVGAIEIDEEDITDPHMNEKRFVTGLAGRVRIVSPEAFLTQQMVSSFKEIYNLDLEILSMGYRIEGHRAMGKEEILNTIRIRSLNFLIQATKRNMDAAFIDEAMNIHQLMEKL